MTDSHIHMDPSTLESLIMLRTNRDMWDVRDIQWAIDNPGYFEGTSNSDSIQEMQEEPDPSFTRVLRQRTNDPEPDDITTISSGSSRVVPGLGWQPPISVRSASSSSSSSSSGVVTLVGTSRRNIRYIRNIFYLFIYLSYWYSKYIYLFIYSF